MKVLMFYTLAADGLAKVGDNLAAHQARLHAFHAQGSLLMAGPYGLPPVGALAVFTSREAAEAFMAEDPFVLNGVVGSHRIEPWAESLMPALAGDTPPA